MRVNEIFYSLQGEGHYAGTPSVFVRFAGCNLRCPFCDTEYESWVEMSEDEIVQRVAQYTALHIVITGGEPTLQLTESLVEKLHGKGKRVAIETNGTNPLPSNIDWITLSPKDAFVEGAEVVLRRVDELKVVFDGLHYPREYDGIEVSHDRFLQPCDTGDAVRNSEVTAATVQYVKDHPEWRLSLQIHKYLNID